jgi:hypothetical protein
VDTIKLGVILLEAPHLGRVQILVLFLSLCLDHDFRIDIVFGHLLMLTRKNNIWKGHNMRTTHFRAAVFASLMLLPLAAFCEDRSAGKPPQAAQLRNCLPARVNLLRESLRQMSGMQKSSVTDPNNRWTRQAHEQTFDWVVKVMNRAWLPPDPNVLRERIIMVQNAFGPNDVTYLQWEASDHSIQVAQTKTIMLIRVRPLSADPAPRLTRETRMAMAREIIPHIIRDQVNFTVNESTGRKRTKRTITSQVLSASFDHAGIQDCADGVHAKFAPPQSGEEHAIDALWWWRYISWWTDGSEIGIYMFKTEGGPRVPSYTSLGDATWFEGLPSKSMVPK